MPLILASASPRRRELIRLLFDDVVICPAAIDETNEGGLGPADYARAVASRKAQVVSQLYSDPVLGADTVVALDGKIFGKPADPAANARMLRELAGKWHEVITAIALWRNGVFAAEDAVVTRVLFTPLSEAEIAEYVASGEGLDKAGGYAIQGLAAKFVAGIDGCYYNVVGLPVSAVAELVKAKQ